MDSKSCGELEDVISYVCHCGKLKLFSSHCPQQIDEFRKLFNSILASIKSLKENLANTSTMRSLEIEQTIKICSSTYSDVQKSIKTLLDNGELNYCFMSVQFNFGTNSIDLNAHQLLTT